jgi:hypothetical protein
MPSANAPAPFSEAPAPSAPATTLLLERATQAFALTILDNFRNSRTQKVYDLVDRLSMNIEILLPVLDLLSRSYGYLEIDRGDQRGNYDVRITQRGVDYLSAPNL